MSTHDTPILTESLVNQQNRLELTSYSYAIVNDENIDLSKCLLERHIVRGFFGLWRYLIDNCPWGVHILRHAPRGRGAGEV